MNILGRPFEAGKGFFWDFLSNSFLMGSEKEKFITMSEVMMSMKKKQTTTKKSMNLQ